jgi:MFS family permease
MLLNLPFGAGLDYFESKGKIETAFLLYGVFLFLLTIAHVVITVFMKERKEQSSEANAISKKSFIEASKIVLTNKAFLLMIPLQILFSVLSAAYAYCGTYRINELGFTMSALAIIGVIVSASRAALSLPIGRLADKKSFSFVISIGTVLFIIGFLICAVVPPENGQIPFAIFEILFAIGAAATTAPRLNMLYDYIPHETRAEGTALFNCIYGISLILTSAGFSLLMEYIQSHGNTFLIFDKIYAQQVMSGITVISLIAALIYLNLITKILRHGGKKSILKDEE